MKYLIFLILFLYYNNAAAQLQINYFRGTNIKTNSNELLGVITFYAEPQRPILNTCAFNQLQLCYQFKLSKNKYFSLGITYAENAISNVAVNAKKAGTTKIRDIGAYIGYGFQTKLNANLNFFAEQGFSWQIPFKNENELFFSSGSGVDNLLDTVSYIYTINQRTSNKWVSLTQVGLDYRINSSTSLKLGFTFLGEINKTVNQNVYNEYRINNVIDTRSKGGTPLAREFAWGPTLGFKYFFIEKKRKEFR